VDLASINLEYLGAAALPIAILWYWNVQLRSDIKAERINSKMERAYSQAIEDRYNKLWQDLAGKNADSMSQLATAFDLLRESVR
jgi:hypothetical protein